jgi:exodeoxyribonuclease VII small subunit
MSNKQPDIQSLAFESAFAELTETIQKLEADNLPLTEIIALYQRGMTLANHCTATLDTAELTIKQLTPAGTLTDFDD